VIDMRMWVLADEGAVFGSGQGEVRLFRTKRQAQRWRSDNLLYGAYDRWKPKKVRITDAK
jgi:hypothetical protein